MDENSEDDVKHANIEEIIQQYARVAFFRNMTIGPDDMRQFIRKSIPSDTSRYKFLIDKAERWRMNWQSAMFGKQWFLEFVSRLEPTVESRLMLEGARPGGRE